MDVRVSPATVAIPALTAGPAQTTLLAVHRRATRRGSWIIDPRHWDGLPDGYRRATTDRVPDPSDTPGPDLVATAPNPLEALLTRSAGHHSPRRTSLLGGLPHCRRTGPPPERPVLSELISTRIKAHASKLGLTHLAASLEQLCQRADVEQLGYLDFLDLIIEEELGIRDGRRFRAALRLSKLPRHKTIDEFDFSFQPDRDTRKVRDLAALSFIDTKSTWPS